MSDVIVAGVCNKYVNFVKNMGVTHPYCKVWYYNLKNLIKTKKYAH